MPDTQKAMKAKSTWGPISRVYMLCSGDKNTWMEDDEKIDFATSRLEMGNCMKETISRRVNRSTMAPQGVI